jgi:hypothetical protein
MDSGQRITHSDIRAREFRIGRGACPAKVGTGFAIKDMRIEELTAVPTRKARAVTQAQLVGGTDAGRIGEVELLHADPF